MALCTQFPCVQHSSPGCVLYQCCGDMTFPWLLPIALLGTHPPLEEPRAALELTAVSHGCVELSLAPGPSDVLLPLFLLAHAQLAQRSRCGSASFSVTFSICPGCNYLCEAAGTARLLATKSCHETAVALQDPQLTAWSVTDECSK